MSLKRLIILISAVLSGITIVSSSVLIVLTSRLNKNAEAIGRAVESVRIAKDIQLNLQEFNKSILIYQATGEKSYLKQLDSLLSRIGQQIEESKKYSYVPAETEIIKNLQGTFVRSMKFKDETDSQVRKKDFVSLSHAREMETLLALSQSLSDINSDQSRQLVEASAADDDLANLTGLFALGFAVFSLPLVFFVLQEWLYRPVSNLSLAISRFTEKSQTRIQPSRIHEFNIISESFNKMADRLSEQKNNQLQFLAAVSHDLRNPLGAVQMAANVLKDECDEDQKSMADVIIRQTQYLDRMVGDLLDSTRIESGSLELVKSRCNLSQIVSNSIKLNSALSRIHRINFVESKPFFGKFDQVRLSQVINNLINNAIKYSPNGGSINVEVTQEHNKISIGIRDQGIGIAQDELKHIFEPFKRTKLTKQSIPGVGLGLSVTKKIVEAHSGSIEVWSEPGKGTEFTVILPTG